MASSAVNSERATSRIKVYKFVNVWQVQWMSCDWPHGASFDTWDEAITFAYSL